MELATAEANTRFVALTTIATGTLLVVSPARLGRMAGVDEPRTARLIGAADLVVGAGLLTARPRWPWMAARAALNLPMAAAVARGGRTTSRLSALTLLGLTLADARTALALRDARR